jgi:hypothetical protein
VLCLVELLTQHYIELSDAFIHFVCGLFENAASKSRCITLKDTTINE